ncbi:TonB-dependent receptor [uncultured Psychroserpens sp.]|uniref:TonB-dependent receptor n=1 Tax=uncultured Psychroserpens sp. TaxID=255436 RepID=UPI002622FB04|nr:TonB-dependent receptor [uncultured Psychroserpens sp.]
MKYILSVLLIFSFLFCEAQTITVLEEGTTEPISGVAIFNFKKDKSVITNIDGKASLELFTENETIYLQNILYKKKAIKITQLGVDFTVYLTPRIEDLNEVVVSASKFEQSKRDIPQTIVNISSKNIQFENPQTSADLLESTGNVYIQKSQLGGGSPLIRGFSTNRLLITVDGVRMNNATFRGGNLQNVISIDPFTIQNTEITLGAGSVVYGSDAIGGVMSFYTQKPQLSYKDSLYFNANAALRYATANKEKTGHLDLNFGLKKWAFLSSISYTDFDDLRMGKHGPDDYLRTEYVETVNGEDVVVQNENPRIQTPTGYDQINFLQKVRYEPKENLNFDLGLYYSTTSSYSRYDRLLRYLDGNLRSAEWNYGPQRWFMGNFQVTKLSSSSNLYDKIQATAAYQNFQESRHDRDFQSDIRNIREEMVDAYSLNVDLEKGLSTKSKLFYGLEYVYNKVNSDGLETNIAANTNTPTVSRYPDGSNWQSIAAYASFKYKPNSKFVFQSGLRYNHIVAKADFTENNQFLNLPFNSTRLNSGAVTGTAGISWMPSKMMQWKFNASTAFRAPNIDDIGKVFDSEPGSVVVPNPNLRPEYAYGGELGFRLNVDDVFIVDMATYYTFLDNALVRRDFTLNGESQILYDGELSNVQAIQNASKAWIYGFEAGVRINFSKRLKLTSQYNIIGGTEDENGIEVPVRHIAPNFGNTHFVWQNEKFEIDAFAEYNNELSFSQFAPSERSKTFIYALDENGNPYAPAWYTFNLRTQYKISNATTIIASLENITDQRYRTYSSGIAAPGRNLILAFRYSL